MKKILDLTVKENTQLNQNYCLLKLTPSDSSTLPNMYPGQFVQIRVDGSQKTFLRRPISVNFVDKQKNELWLLIQKVGDGTHIISQSKKGDILNLILPLGNTFSLPQNTDSNILLIGGGVGTAPLLYLGSVLKSKGYNPLFLLGARSKNDLLQLNNFEQYGKVFCTTEDGSFGEIGYVTNHSILSNIPISMIYTCGPKPMMVAVAKYASKHKIKCEASLENLMACGIGACLCCVEGSREGNICVCTDGPVFNIDKLTWIN